MARPGQEIKSRVKAEPGLRNGGFPAVYQASETHRSSESGRRNSRSGAPSIDSRPNAAAAPAMTYRDDESNGGDDLILMEVKSSEPKREAGTSGSLSGSFIAPNHALMTMGEGLKEINDTLGELQALGISHVVPTLPELVLVGDQSAGKSSLMSAIAGLSLPRSSGTCTRCPIHIRTIRADEWSCRISLQKDYRYVPRDHPITPEDVTERDPFPPWESQIRVVHDFKTIRDKLDSTEFDIALRWAQVAILTPSTPPEVFIRELNGPAHDMGERLKTREDSTEAQFSPNTVALEIRGNDLADLSFYDLPGIIVSAKRAEDRFLEKVVKNLAQEYIRHPGAIVLWAVPMNNDAECSSALSVIRELNADKRCIGAMTKADLLPVGDHKNWLDMLAGHIHPLGLGYFITSRKNAQDLEEQNKIEEAFFNRTGPGDWPLEFDQFHDRCGVDRLKVFLSNKLRENFARVLPVVKRKIQERLQVILKDLESLPDVPQNAELEVTKSLSEFGGAVQATVTSKDFFVKWDQLAEGFKKDIIGMKPKYWVSPKLRESNIGIANLEADGLMIVGSTPKRRAPDNSEITPSKRPRQAFTRSIKEEMDTSPSVPGGRFRSIPLAPTRKHVVFPSIPSKFTIPSKTLPQLHDMIDATATPGQPDLLSSAVHETLCMEAVTPWSYALDQLISQTFVLLKDQMLAILDESFLKLKNRLVYIEAKSHITTLIHKHETTLSDQLRFIYSLEGKLLFTKNKEMFTLHRATELKILARSRHYHRWAAHEGLQDIPPLAKYENISEEERRQEEMNMQKQIQKLGPDPYQKELEVAAYVRAYYLTAAMRFIDIVCLHVTSGLFPNISTGIQMHLLKKLGLMNSPDASTWKRLMEEDTVKAAKREETKKQKRNLEQAMQSIIKLENQPHVLGAPHMHSIRQQTLGSGEHEILGITPPRSELSGPMFTASQLDAEA